LQDLPNITWHFIGHLQRNKAKLALTHFDWIHSVDSLRLAEHLETLIASGAPSPQLCLQVKLREDPSKYGWTPAELLAALPNLASYSHLHLEGLMTILPLSIPAAKTGSIFAELKTLAQTLQQHPHHPLVLPELSMGMSDDYQAAIQAGATMVRLGRILFSP
jgi:PLP dependent protein